MSHGTIDSEVSSESVAQQQEGKSMFGSCDNQACRSWTLVFADPSSWTSLMNPQARVIVSSKTSILGL